MSVRATTFIGLTLHLNHRVCQIFVQVEEVLLVVQALLLCISCPLATELAMAQSLVSIELILTDSASDNRDEGAPLSF